MARVILFVKLMGKFLRKELLWRIRCLFTQGLADNERLFIKENSHFWSSYKNGDRGDGYVLVEPTGHGAIFLSNASFAAIVAHARKLRPLFLLMNREETSLRQIASSYPGATYVYLTDWRFIMPQVRAWFAARRAYRSLRNPRDLFELKVEGVRVGDTIYDGVLAQGYATVQEVDEKVFRAVLASLRYYYLFQEIIRRYRIEAAVLCQLMGPMGGILGKCLLQNGIEVLNRVGSHQILVKKFRTVGEMGNHPTTPEQAYFDLMVNGDNGDAQRLAEEYLERRLGGRIARIDAAEAFDPRKKTFTERGSFCAEYNLDPSRPIVFVMLHAFNDCPHWNFPKKMIFLDYYHWFIRTVEIAKTVSQVNWIFKEHPCARFYPTRDVDVKATVEGARALGVRFIDGEADFNTRSLRHLAHAVVTGFGTAGLECSAYGIPCILAGEGSYSGFGFTIEPNTAEEYEACLRNIDRLKPLSEQQVKAAKTVAYFYFCIAESHKYYFCPRFDHDELSEWDAEKSQTLWKRAAADFQDERQVGKMRWQIEELSRFVRNPAWTQYIDLTQYPFLSRVIPMEGSSSRFTEIT